MIHPSPAPGESNLCQYLFFVCPGCKNRTESERIPCGRSIVFGKSAVLGRNAEVALDIRKNAVPQGARLLDVPRL